MIFFDYEKLTIHPESRKCELTGKINVSQNVTRKVVFATQILCYI